MATFSEKYEIIEKISEGTFGRVYKGKNKITGELVAIKIEDRNETNINTLLVEARIYQYLGKQKGFPQLKWFQTNSKHNILVINYLGKSLNNFRNPIELNIVKNIGSQIFKRIELLHSKQLIHRDIKPHNLLLSKDKTTIYLIDFSFAKRFIVNEQHMKEVTTNKIIGSLNFVSLNVHKRIEPSRRDDLISAIYVLIYLYFGKLEWENCANENTMICLKESILNVDNIPSVFRNLLLYCQSLAFNVDPDYEYITQLLYK